MESRYDIDPNLRSVFLVDYYQPFLELFENGSIYDHKNKCWKYCSTKKHGKILHINNRDYYVNLLVRKYFLSPWYDPTFILRYKRLDFIECSNYWIIEDGRVFSTYTYKYLSPKVNEDGYLCYTLQKDDRSRIYPGMHRLLALAFIPNPDNKLQVNHIDGNKKNNSLSNLEWTDNWENMLHARVNGLRESSISDKVLHEICKLLEKGVPRPEICRKLGVTRVQICDLYHGCHKRITSRYNIKGIDFTEEERQKYRSGRYSSDIIL